MKDFVSNGSLCGSETSGLWGQGIEIGSRNCKCGIEKAAKSKVDKLSKSLISD